MTSIPIQSSVTIPKAKLTSVSSQFPGVQSDVTFDVHGVNDAELTVE